MAANGQLVFTDVDKVTFKGVGNTSNAVIDTITGKLGVGVDSPDANLHIIGNCFVSTDLTASTLSGNGSGLTALNATNITTGTLTAARIPVLDAAKITTGTLPVTRGGTGTTTSTGTGSVVLSAAPAFTGDVTFDTDTLKIDSTNNRVGIGTTTPDYKLHVEDLTNPRIMLENTDTALALNQDIGSIIFKQNDNTGSTGTGIIGKIRMSSVIAPPAGTFYGESANMIFSVGNYANNNANTDALTIRGNGNVGIGTNTPSHALNVKAASGDAEVHIQAQGNNGGDAIIYFNGSSTNQRKCAILSSNVAPNSYCKQDLHFCMETTNDLSDVDITDSKMVITNAGNVGIGTTNPGSALEVNGTIASTHVSIGTTNHPTLGGHWLTIEGPTYNGTLGVQHPDPEGGILFTNKSSGGAFPWGYYMGVVKDVASTSSTSLRFDIGKSNDLSTPDSTSRADTLTPYFTIDNGNVGIGTITPYAKLHVVGNAGATAAGAHYGFKYNVAVGTFYTGSQNGISIYADNDIVAGQWVLSHAGTMGSSDERIKKEIVDVEDGEALSTIRLLKPKRYKYRDDVKRGIEPVWGFIAQEVADTIPYATQKRTECIPNIYETVNVSASNVITFTNFNTTNLESKTTSRLKLYDTKNTEHMVKITGILGEHSIQVEEDLTDWIGSFDESNTEGNEIFVYGEEVNDFHFLKKDAIWTVATAALQEVDRQLQVERSRNDTLEARILALENA